MRWLMLSDDFPPLDGGVATWAATVAAGLAAAGDEVVVLTRRRPGTPERVGGARVVGVGGPSFGRHGATWLWGASLRHLLRVDRILATTWQVARRVAPWARAAGVPVDVVGHGSDLTRVRPGTPDARRLGALLSIVDRTFVVSSWLGRRLGSLGGRPVVLPSPVDAHPPRPAADRAARWLYVARATPLKGGDRFVRLVAAAGVEGTLVGDGPERPAWEALGRTTGARVTFAGRVEHAALAAIYSAHDLVLLLPREDVDGTGGEGLGLVLLEGAAWGVPGVGCRTGGVQEALGPGLTLDDPDDTDRSITQIGAWWTPRRGAESNAWLRDVHGVDKTIAALRSPRAGGTAGDRRAVAGAGR